MDSAVLPDKLYQDIKSKLSQIRKDYDHMIVASEIAFGIKRFTVLNKMEPDDWADFVLSKFIEVIGDKWVIKPKE